MRQGILYDNFTAVGARDGDLKEHQALERNRKKERSSRRFGTMLGQAKSTKMSHTKHTSSFSPVDMRIGTGNKKPTTASMIKGHSCMRVTCATTPFIAPLPKYESEEQTNRSRENHQNIQNEIDTHTHTSHTPHTSEHTKTHAHTNCARL